MGIHENSLYYLCNFSTNLKNKVHFKNMQFSEQDLGINWMLGLVKSEVEEDVYFLAWGTGKMEGLLSKKGSK